MARINKEKKLDYYQKLIDEDQFDKVKKELLVEKIESLKGIKENIVNIKGLCFINMPILEENFIELEQIGIKFDKVVFVEYSEYQEDKNFQKGI